MKSSCRPCDNCIYAIFWHDNEVIDCKYPCYDESDKKIIDEVLNNKNGSCPFCKLNKLVN